MYDIKELSKMSQEDLIAIAQKLNISKAKNFSKEELVYEILDEQAKQGSISNEPLLKRPLVQKQQKQRMKLSKTSDKESLKNDSIPQIEEKPLVIIPKNEPTKLAAKVKIAPKPKSPRVIEIKKLGPKVEPIANESAIEENKTAIINDQEIAVMCSS